MSLQRGKTVTCKGSRIRMTSDFSIATRQGRKTFKIHKENIPTTIRDSAKLPKDIVRAFIWRKNRTLSDTQVLKKLISMYSFSRSLRRYAPTKMKAKESRKGRMWHVEEFVSAPYPVLLEAGLCGVHLRLRLCSATEIHQQEIWRKGKQGQPKDLMGLRDLQSNCSTHSTTHFSWISLSLTFFSPFLILSPPTYLLFLPLLQ